MTARAHQNGLPASAQAWAAALYAGARLPDARLGKRLVRLSATLASRPGDSVNRACGAWSESKAGYRFVENERVEAQALREAHSQAAAAAAAALPEILSVQDTTAVRFPSARGAAGLGPVSVEPHSRGMLYHPAVALRMDGMPLGLLHQQTWCRDAPVPPQAGPKRSKPPQERESRKWLDGIHGARAALQAVAEADRPRLIHVFDREGDVHEVFEALWDSQDGAVIRCAQNRKALLEDGTVGLGQALARAAPVLGLITLEVPRKRGQAPRSATLEVRAVDLTLAPDRRKHPRRRRVSLALVEVWERSAPQGVEPLHWLLWTTEPVATLDQARRVVEIYKKRWKLEEVFLALKEGCRVEKVQFDTAERLDKVLALYAPVALRIVQLRDAARNQPDAPCTVLLADEEWKALWTYIHRQPLPPNTPAPTVRQAALWIGRLGGHLGRKSDGMPGVRTLWRGWRDLALLSALYTALQTPGYP